MFANADIVGQERKNVLAVPESALVMREDQKTVFVVAEENRVVQKVLKLGDAAGGYVVTERMLDMFKSSKGEK